MMITHDDRLRLAGLDQNGKYVNRIDRVGDWWPEGSNLPDTSRTVEDNYVPTHPAGLCKLKGK